MKQGIKKAMNKYQESRWVALMDCVNLIEEKAEQLNVDFNSIQFNHPAMMKYVDEISDDILRISDQ